MARLSVSGSLASLGWNKDIRKLFDDAVYHWFDEDPMLNRKRVGKYRDYLRKKNRNSFMTIRLVVN